MLTLCTRTLVLVLCLRAILAPFTYRPARTEPFARYSLVMRARWWPPQRLQRYSASSKLLRLYQGKNRDVSVSGRCGRPSSRFAAWDCSTVPSGAVVAIEPKGFLASRQAIVLRC